MPGTQSRRSQLAAIVISVVISGQDQRGGPFPFPSGLRPASVSLPGSRAPLQTFGSAPAAALGASSQPGLKKTIPTVQGHLDPDPVAQLGSDGPTLHGPRVTVRYCSRPRPRGQHRGEQKPGQRPGIQSVGLAPRGRA